MPTRMLGGDSRRHTALTGVSTRAGDTPDLGVTIHVLTSTNVPVGRVAGNREQQFADLPEHKPRRTKKIAKQGRASVPTINQLVRGRHDKPAKTKTAALKEPATSRRVHPRVHHDPEEAELGAAEGRPCAADHRRRGHRLHPG